MTPYAEKLIARHSGTLITGRWQDRWTSQKVTAIDDNGTFVLCRFASGNMHEIPRKEFGERWERI